MDYARSMGRLESAPNLKEHVERLWPWTESLSHPFSQSLAPHELKCEKCLTVVLSNLIDLDNVRMGEARHCLRFTAQASSGNLCISPFHSTRSKQLNSHFSIRESSYAE